MFFNRKHMLEFGYKVVGLDFGRNDTLNHYVKYFDKCFSIVSFSSLNNNQVKVYKFSKSDYKSFHEGKFAIGSGGGSTPGGYPLKNIPHITVFAGGELANRKSLKVFLDKAEKIAAGESNEVKITNIKLK